MSLRKKKQPNGSAAVAKRSSITKTKTKSTLSDRISELLLPQPLLDPEIDAGDETRAQTHRYDDDAAASDDDNEIGEIDPRFSDIRKRNAKLLQDVDRKYSGRIMSRKEFEREEAEVGGGSSDEEDDDDGSDGSDDGVGGNGKTDDVDDASDGEKYEYSSDEADDANDETDSDGDGDGSGVDAAEADHSEQSGDDENIDDDEADSNDSDDDDEDDDDDDDDDFDLAPKSRHTATDAEPSSSVRVVRPVDAADELQKGHCVQNQLHIWEKLLEMRIHSQKLLIHANTLPAHEQLNAMRADSGELAGAAQRCGQSVSLLLDRLGELQHLLVDQFAETKDVATTFAASAKRKRKQTDDDEEEDESARRIRRHGDQLTERFDAYTDYRNAVLLKWHDRTKVLTPGTREGRHAAQHNILQNIEGVLANRAEMRRKTQLHKGGYSMMGVQVKEDGGGGVVGDVEKSVDVDAVGPKGEKADEVYSTEIYDDSDFYHTQLRELIEFKASGGGVGAAGTPSEMNKQLAELQKLRKKMKKAVDTRASKGRKIRYVVHNKLVNFMARNEEAGGGNWTDEGKTELYSSLFGARM